jgi:hypothetical protein
VANDDTLTPLLGTTVAQRAGVWATQPSGQVVSPLAHVSTLLALHWHVGSASIPLGASACLDPARGSHPAASNARAIATRVILRIGSHEAITSVPRF